jgi:hypothetical protein
MIQKFSNTPRKIILNRTRLKFSTELEYIPFDCNFWHMIHALKQLRTLLCLRMHTVNKNSKFMM